MKPKKVTFDPKSRKVRSICSGCKEFFSDGEEVFLCPVDEAPHHRKCWLLNKKSCSKCGYQEIPLTKKIPFVSIFKTLFFLCLTGIVILAGVLLVKLILLEKEEINRIGEPTVISETSPVPSVTPLPYDGSTEETQEETQEEVEIPEEPSSSPTEKIIQEEPTKIPTEVPAEVLPYGKQPPVNQPNSKPTKSPDGTYSL